MHSKAIFSISLGILAVGLIQIGFAEEFDNTTFIVIDNQEFEQPETRHSVQEIKISGHVDDYFRGDVITLVIVYPDGSEEEISIYGSKKGDIFTLLRITNESQIGTHMIFLDYGADLAYTSFEIVESK